MATPSDSPSYPRAFRVCFAAGFASGESPDWQDVPEEFQAALAALDRLDDQSLWQVARGQLSQADLEPYDQSNRRVD